MNNKYLTCPDCGGIVEIYIEHAIDGEDIPYTECTGCQARWNTFGENK